MKGIVKEAVHAKTTSGANGDLHIYAIKIEGDDKKYTFLSNKNPQTAFEVGKEVEFTVEEKVNGQYTNYNIKPVKKPFVGGFGGGGGVSKSDADRRLALQCAVDMLCAGKIEPKELRPTFDKFVKEYLGSAE